MKSDSLPNWLTVRAARKPIVKERPSKYSLTALMFLFGVLTVLAALTAFKIPAYLHIPVIGACIVLFAAVVMAPIKCTLKTLEGFVIGAIIANLTMAYLFAKASTVSEIGATASVILFTGLIGLLLFTRTDRRPSRTSKAIVLGTVITLCAIGPVMYMSGWHHGTVGIITGWFLIASLPMLFLSFVAAWIAIAYHNSEATLPHHNWI